MPTTPKRPRTRSALARMWYEAKAVIAMATKTGIACHQRRDCPMRTIAVEIAPGPASMGTPSGVTPTSSFCCPSLSSASLSWVPDRRASSISMATKKRSTPPAILNAGSVIPKTLKIRLPARAKPLNTAKHVQEACLAAARLRSSRSPAVSARKEGTVASGSTMKKIELRATSENWINASICCLSIAGFRKTTRPVAWPVAFLARFPRGERLRLFQYGCSSPPQKRPSSLSDNTQHAH